jgi:E-phenylitaconyl-CoA hydratase
LGPPDEIQSDCQIDCLWEYLAEHIAHELDGDPGEVRSIQPRSVPPQGYRPLRREISNFRYLLCPEEDHVTHPATVVARVPVKGEAVQFRVADRIAWVTLDRPEKKNAINRPMRRELQDAYRRIKHDPDIWATILTANGDVFCSGKDLLEKAIPEDGSVMDNDELYIFQRHIYKPFILALNGPCLAQGAGFALNADIIIMAESASIGWPQVKRGISTVSGPTLAPHALPWAVAMAYLMRGKPVPAQECLRFGLANEVVPRAQILEVAERWAQEIMESAPLAVRAVKEAARRGINLTFEERVPLAREIANRVLNSDDSKEGINAFREKRKPVWKGR